MKNKKVDTQYRDLLQSILDNGIRSESQMEVDTITYLSPPSLRFDLSKEFPIITERKVSEKMWKGAVGELFGFINGARTHDQLTEYGCKWWKAWVNERKCSKRGLETGDLGPGSYGAAFHDFPTSEGETFNQFEAILQQIKERPFLKTHFITPWIPQYNVRIKGRTQKVVVCPCHGWINIRILNNKLYLHMYQRSCDVPIGLPANLAQYAALTLALAQVTGYKVGEYIHSFSDAHVYVDQVDKIKKLFKREARPLPKMILKNKKKNLFDYRANDFELVNYDPHPGIWDIPVVV
ncbi:MAG: thymidylate synthase [Patescibacteria group bacterium]